MITVNSDSVLIATYMTASKRYGTIYTGVTSWLPGRAHRHREKLREGFTKKYGVHRLVWFEVHADMKSAIQREKSIKKYQRERKINLIERENLYWADLYPSLVDVNRGHPMLQKNPTPK